MCARLRPSVRAYVLLHGPNTNRDEAPERCRLPCASARIDVDGLGSMRAIRNAGGGMLSCCWMHPVAADASVLRLRSHSSWNQGKGVYFAKVPFKKAASH